MMLHERCVCVCVCVDRCQFTKGHPASVEGSKRLQAQANRIESRFYEEVHQLECKYAAQYSPLCDRVSTQF